MRNLTNLRARRLIIHKTDTEQDLENFRASEAETPMTPAIQAYFEAHLQGTLKTSVTQSARFMDVQADVPARLCRRMIDSEQEFLDGSKKLAQKYLAVVAAMTRGKQQIALGSLAFLQCEGQ